ncbi:MAG: alpha/beta hydrolase [Gordonia sp. (in: high G+C Gram-positive bacteria)]
MLISGTGCDDTFWEPALASLSGFRVITLHNRGVGNSSDIPDGWTTRDCAGDVISVLDAAGVESAGVYGHSLGGRIAQWVAADHPDRVRRLVLGATTVGDVGGVPRSAAAVEAFASGSISALLGLAFSAGYRASHPDAARVLVNHLRPRDRRRQFAMSSAHDGRAALAAIVAPTLIVHGRDDGITDVANAAILQDGIAGADLLLLSGASHNYLYDRPEVNGVVAAFLAGASDAPRRIQQTWT